MISHTKSILIFSPLEAARALHVQQMLVTIKVVTKNIIIINNYKKEPT